ncbi:hypothetical protein DICVIV_09714 [Dictyocaulus viviparus]|uniref:G-protein coupled receptors family 1 profile domain-containing protein n=1 Tax=Dictyocaulus viviparus TaxID=29172 RepID=A0A0D8XKB4_DICVI|nr:hypothetical protein DICVIV_09714 [Dictyocaulus viviparus]
MDEEATTVIRTICAGLILLPTVIGLTIHLIVLTALYKGRKIFYKNSFYLIITQIIGCNIYSLFLLLYIAFPIILTGVQYMGDSFVFYYGPLFLESVTFSGMVLLTFLLTINRLTIFILPKLNVVLFTVKNTLLISGILWLYNFALTTSIEISGCKKLFSKDEFYLWDDCTKTINGGFMLIQTYQELLLTSLMCFIYVTIYIKIKISQKYSTNAFKNEKVFLIQTIPLSVILAVELLAFKLIPMLNVTDNRRLFINISGSLLIILVDITSPILLLLFNKDIQKFASDIFFSSLFQSPSSLSRRHIQSFLHNK